MTYKITLVYTSLIKKQIFIKLDIPWFFLPTPELDIIRPIDPRRKNRAIYKREKAFMEIRGEFDKILT